MIVIFMFSLLSRFFPGVEPVFNADSPKGFHHVKKPLEGIRLKACQRQKKENIWKRGLASVTE